MGRRHIVVISEEPRGSVAVMQALHRFEAHRRRFNVKLFCIFVLVLAILLLGFSCDELVEPLVFFAVCWHSGAVTSLEVPAVPLELVDEFVHVDFD